MPWIEDILKPALAELTNRIKVNSGLFKTSGDTVTVTNDPVTGYDQIMIHGNTFLVEKQATTEQGFLILDPDNNDMPVGILSAGIDTAARETVHSLILLSSNKNRVVTGDVEDISTAFLIRKKDVDNDSKGLVVVVGDEDLNALSEDFPLFAVTNGQENNKEIFSITARGIKHSNQGDNADGSQTAGYLAMFSPEGVLMTGEALPNLNTTAQNVIEAINELHGQVTGVSGTSGNKVLAHGKFDIHQSSDADGNNDEVQLNDVASGWIGDKWIHGAFVGSGDPNIVNDPQNIDHWFIFFEWDKPGNDTTMIIGTGTIGTGTIG